MDFLLISLSLDFWLWSKAFFTGAHKSFRAIGKMRVFAQFKFRIKIKNQSLYVIRAFLEVPKNLVTACLVMEHFDDAFTFDVFPTGSRIL